MGADFLINEPTLQENNGTLQNNPNVENYLHEAGLARNALLEYPLINAKNHGVTKEEIAAIVTHVLLISVA